MTKKDLLRSFAYLSSVLILIFTLTFLFISFSGGEAKTSDRKTKNSIPTSVINPSSK